GLFRIHAIRIATNLAGNFSAAQVRRKIAAAVGADEFEVGELVERTVQHHAGEKESGFQRVSDNVTQISSQIAPSIVFDDVVRAGRVLKDGHVQLLSFGPENVVLRIGQRLAVHMSGNCRSFVAEFSGVLQLSSGKVGKLQ